MIPVHFHPAAELELLREVSYYSRARKGSGIRFAAALEQVVARAASRPLSGAMSFKNTRGMLVKGFPFTLVYRVDADRILVVAVSPHRKRPNHWVSRVE